MESLRNLLTHACLTLFFMAAALITGCGQGDDGSYQEVTEIPATAELSEGDLSQASTASDATNDAGTLTSESHDSAVDTNAGTDDAKTAATDKEPASGDESQTVKSKADKFEVQGDTTAATPPDQTPVTKPATTTDNTRAGDSTIAAAAESAKSGSEEDMPVRIVTLLIPDRKFQTEGPEDAIRVSYDDLDLLKVLNMEPVTKNAAELMPTWLKELDGKRIRIRGFMYPTFEETGIETFLLARDNQICCFGRNPKIYDLIEIAMRKGKSTRYIQNRPFDVVGVFHIVPAAKDDDLYQLYQIDDAIVIDK